MFFAWLYLWISRRLSRLDSLDNNCVRTPGSGKAIARPPRLQSAVGKGVIRVWSGDVLPRERMPATGERLLLRLPIHVMTRSGHVQVPMVGIKPLSLPIELRTSQGMAHIESLGSSVLDESKPFFQAANWCVQRPNFGSQGGEKQINASYGKRLGWAVLSL